MRILMLEDNRDRIAAFSAAVEQLGDCRLMIWRNAPDMIRDLPVQLPGTSLISLDHDLVPDEGECDPGDGLQVAVALSRQTPVCPIVLHTSNRDRAYSMIRELQDGGWEVTRSAPIGMGEEWIGRFWLPAIRRLLGA